LRFRFAPRQVTQLGFCRCQPVLPGIQLIGDRDQTPFAQLAFTFELLMLTAPCKHGHACRIHGDPRIAQTGPNRLQVFERALGALGLRHFGQGGLDLFRVAPCRVAQCIELRVDSCALGFGTGLGTTGVGEVRFGLATCVSGPAVGLVEIRQPFDPDLMRLSRSRGLGLRRYRLGLQYG
jgi:hypothetical protein